MRQKTLRLAAMMMLFSGAKALQAQDGRTINVVTTAVPFLRISPEARAGGMGEVGIATSPDGNSSFWNLAKTPFSNSQAGIGLTYTPWLKRLGLNDIYLASLAGFYKLDDNSAISASLRYFSLGNIEFTDGAGNSWGQGRPREFAFDAGYSRKLSDKLGLGVALRYINSNLTAGAVPSSGSITYKAGTTVAGDLSLYYNGVKENTGGISAGLVISNLGGKIGYTNDANSKDYIPANLGLGVAYTSIFDEANKITFGLDINKLLVPTPPAYTGNTSADSAAVAGYRSKSVVSSWFSSFGDASGGFGEELREFHFGLGAEYWYQDQFAFRAGYFYEDKTKGNRKYFTLGAGVKYNVFGLNFSYIIPSGQGINQNPLSNTLRFSLLFDIEGNGGGSTSTSN